MYNSGAETHCSEIVWEPTNYQELYTGLQLNCRDFFYLGDFVGSSGIMLLKFRLLCSLDIFWNHATWSQKEEILRFASSTATSAPGICAWLSCCGSFGIMPILQQIHVTSTCCSLSFIFIGGTGVLELVQPFVFIAERPTIAQFDAEPVGRFLPPQLLRREKWAKHFLVFPQFALQVTLIDGEF